MAACLTLAACAQPPASAPEPKPAPPVATATAPVVADDFESHTTGVLGAPWKEEMYNSGSSVVVDSGHVFRGTRAMHATAPGGANKRRAYYAIHLRDKYPALETAMYGRVMVWLDAAPEVAPGAPPVQWTLLQGEGRSADDVYNSIYRLALEQDGSRRLMANFETTPPTRTNCKQQSARQLPLRRWACVEWHMTVAENEMQFWLDGEELLHIRGRGDATSSCQGHDLGDVWKAPPKFQSFYLGFERYGNSTNDQNLWLDDFVLSTTRVGCPDTQGR